MSVRLAESLDSLPLNPSALLPVPPSWISLDLLKASSTLLPEGLCAGMLSPTPQPHL